MKEFSLSFLLFLLGVILAMNFQLYWAMMAYAVSIIVFAWAIAKEIGRARKSKIK